MKKFFSILCHQWNDNLALTIEYLSSFSENKVLIHLDTKMATIEPFAKLVKDNVTILSSRFDIKWGGIQMVKATLALMSASDCYQYDYFFLLSGDDLLVSNNLKINNILESSIGKDFIHLQDERNCYVDPYQRFKKKYPKLTYKKNKNIFEKIYLRLTHAFLSRNDMGMRYLVKKNIKLYKGSQWFTIRKQTVKKILDFNQHNPDYLKSFEFSFCPDEMFFHSLIMSQHDQNRYCDKSKVNDCLRFMEWNTGPEYPKLLSKNEIFALRDKGYFFARKVNVTLSESEFMWMMA